MSVESRHTQPTRVASNNHSHCSLMHARLQHIVEMEIYFTPLERELAVWWCRTTLLFTHNVCARCVCLRFDTQVWARNTAELIIHPYKMMMKYLSRKKVHHLEINRFYSNLKYYEKFKITVNNKQQVFTLVCVWRVGAMLNISF
jgi:hypothetical protein